MHQQRYLKLSNGFVNNTHHATFSVVKPNFPSQHYHLTKPQYLFAPPWRLIELLLFLPLHELLPHASSSSLVRNKHQFSRNCIRALTKYWGKMCATQPNKSISRCCPSSRRHRRRRHRPKAASQNPAGVAFSLSGRRRRRRQEF